MPDLTLVLCLAGALVLDRLLGEAKHWHPLVGFGWLAQQLERRLNRGRLRKWKGMLALVLCFAPLTAVGILLDRLLTNNLLAATVSAVILYLAIGWRSLEEHAQAVSRALLAKKLPEARAAVSRIVSRDCAQLDATGVSKAATESVLENGADAIFAAIFWFLIAGLPGVIGYRLVNTLDAMWGYKNERFNDFGWAAARLDDLLNYLPARLTALSYALVGQTKLALKCWRTQAKHWKSPNAGPVMSAGAGAIRTSLGGAATYQGASEQRPLLGLDPTPATRPDAHTIDAASKLINKALLLWILACLAITLLIQL